MNGGFPNHGVMTQFNRPGMRKEIRMALEGADPQFVDQASQKSALAAFPEKLSASPKGKISTPIGGVNPD